MGDFEEMCRLHAVIMLCCACVTKLPDDFRNGSMRVQGLYVGPFPLFIRNACSPWSGIYFIGYGDGPRVLG